MQTRAFDLPVTYPFDVNAAISHLTDSDEVLAETIERIGDFNMSLLDFTRPMEAITRAVVFQAISLTAAKTIHERVQKLLGAPFDFEDVLLVGTDDLKAAGLSRSKAAAIVGVAEAMKVGTVPSTTEGYESLSDDEIIDALSSVRGIGVWTAQMILMAALARPDVLPDGDLGIREGFRIAFDLEERPKPKAVREHGEIWSPYRTVASWYLWRAVDAENGGEW